MRRDERIFLGIIVMIIIFLTTLAIFGDRPPEVTHCDGSCAESAGP